MRKYVAIFFLGIYLVTTPQLLELLKIPVMAEHYMTHRAEEPDMNLLNFLCIHYIHDTIQDADYDEDMKLPFKTMCTASISFIAIVYPLNIIEINIQKECLEYIQPKSFYHYSDYSSSYLSSIWQPPRA